MLKQKDLQWKDAASSVIGGMSVAAIVATSDTSPLLGMLEATFAAIIAPKAVDYAARAWDETKYFLGVSEQPPSKKMREKLKDQSLAQKIEQPNVNMKSQHTTKAEPDPERRVQRKEKIKKRDSFTEEALFDKERRANKNLSRE